MNWIFSVNFFTLAFLSNQFLREQSRKWRNPASIFRSLFPSQSISLALNLPHSMTEGGKRKFFLRRQTFSLPWVKIPLWNGWFRLPSRKFSLFHSQRVNREIINFMSSSLTLPSIALNYFSRQICIWTISLEKREEAIFVCLRGYVSPMLETFITRFWFR